MKRETKLKVYRALAIFTLLAALLCGFGLRGRAQNAETVLDNAAAVYQHSNGITADFTMHTRSEQQRVNESFEGKIQMKGDKFTLVTPDMRIWFDGKTQWAYMERSDEVNVTNPEGEELQLTNPAVLLNTYKKGFKATLKGESTSTNGKAAYDIELIPQKKGDIVKIELQVEKATSFPSSIVVTAKNNLVSTVRISNFKTGVNQPDSFFVFNRTDFPDAEIVDLR
ncbi:MAG: outer-membrane lipoprotein carrier protein LolA [Tannerellaceae bacterium]|nr:outer-membrane lipoprotein carrier protein LolA [Tannerellaceae bacterium]MCD8264806.1 outer-membrane lipoprotein carrier protein LolA [Tannerellaceae bacterium]